MTDQEINCAIAELCGWTQIENTNTMAAFGIWRGYPPVGAIIGQRQLLPDYCSDLNAMHEAEEMLYKKQLNSWNKYTEQLQIICDYPIYHSTARQRAEAFLKVFPRWKET